MSNTVKVKSSVPAKRGRKAIIKWNEFNQSWKSRTDKEIALRIAEKYKGQVSPKIGSLVVNVFLHRKKLIASGVDASFQGRVVKNKSGVKEVKKSFVRAGSPALKAAKV